MAVSCLSLLMVKPANAQSGGQIPNYSDYIPTPVVPQFTLRFVQSSYNEIVTDPYTGAITTQQVNNSTIDIIIRNQPFTPYNYGWEYKGEVVNRTTSLWYGVQAKGHYSQYWSDVNLDYPTYYQSNSSYNTVLSIPNDYPANGTVDFRVRAITGGYFPPVLYSDINLPLNFISKNSTWSPTQTITIADGSSSSSISNSPNPTQSPTNTLSPTTSPTPAVPEFSLLAVLPLFLSTLSIAIILKFRKQTKRDML